MDDTSVRNQQLSSFSLNPFNHNCLTFIDHKMVIYSGPIKVTEGNIPGRADSVKYHFITREFPSIFGDDYGF